MYHASLVAGKSEVVSQKLRRTTRELAVKKLMLQGAYSVKSFTFQDGSVLLTAKRANGVDCKLKQFIIHKALAVGGKPMNGLEAYKASRHARAQRARRMDPGLSMNEVELSDG